MTCCPGYFFTYTLERKSTDFNLCDQIEYLYFFKGRVNYPELMPCLQFQTLGIKRLHVVATTTTSTNSSSSSSSLSASHNALPDHQRETKMANVLGENETFVIF